jgi:hypothetical protein
MQDAKPVDGLSSTANGQPPAGALVDQPLLLCYTVFHIVLGQRNRESAAVFSCAKHDRSPQ